MTDQKRLDPRLIILTLVCILYIFIKLTLNTYCITYQIAQCPDNLNLDSYSIEATTNEEATEKVKEILNNNNLNSDDYIITIKDNFIIVEAGQTGETQTETSEETEISENIIVEEIPEGGISLLVDYMAEKEYKLTNGTSIYLNEETTKAYNYIFIMNDSSSRIIFLFNNYEIIEYKSSGIPYKMKITEVLKLNPIGSIGLLEKDANYLGTITEETTILINNYNKPSNTISNLNLYKQDGTLLFEANLILEEEPETPTEPEEPTEPETPSNQIDYTEQIKEVNTNLEEIKNINNSIIIIMCIYIIYDFTRRMFRN